MEFIIPSFPTEISREIEMPDIAELLSYPIFHCASVKQFMKESTEFQRQLLSNVPLRYDRNYIVIQSCVHIQTPTRYSSLTNGSPDFGWHIDSDDSDPEAYLKNPDRVFLLSTKCDSMTEFSENEIVINTGDDRFLDFTGINKYIRDNFESLDVIGKKMPSNRIVTFENHLHRPTHPKRMEFRYVFRVRETNQPYDENIGSVKVFNNWDSLLNQHVTQIMREDNKVTIFYPSL